MEDRVPYIGEGEKPLRQIRGTVIATIGKCRAVSPRPGSLEGPHVTVPFIDTRGQEFMVILSKALAEELVRKISGRLEP